MSVAALFVCRCYKRLTPSGVKPKHQDPGSKFKDQSPKTKGPPPTSSPVPLLSILSTLAWDHHRDPESLVLVATPQERFANSL
jgi:hypothetical protein